MAVLLGLAMLPAGAIAMQVGLNAVAARQSAFEEALGRRALQSIATERSTIDELREMLRVLASSPDLQTIGVADCRRWLDGVRARYPYVSRIAVSDEQNLVQCSAPVLPAGFRAPLTPLRQRARARDAFTIGYIARSAVSGQPMLAALEPIHASSGRRVGFIGASIAIPQLDELLNRGRALDNARAAIVDGEGLIIAQSDANGATAAGLPTRQQMRRILGPDPAFIEVKNGDAVIVPLHAPDLYAVMSWVPDQAPWRRWLGLSVSLAAPLLIWLLAIGAGWFAIEIFVARPLSSLEAAARGFARGEEVAESPTLANSPDEIRALRRTLAAMAKTLRGREQRLVEALVEERALLREVHHRVKNNLQMVASLLNIQARNARDDSEAWGLARAHDRVQLMALIHQRIYSSGEVRQLRLDDLTAEIARQLVQSRGVQTKDLRLKLNLDEARADADRVVPLAFLIGEAISVALDGVADQPADLNVFLTQDLAGEVRFAVDCEAENPGPPGPGARLIDAFARQLGATVGRVPERPLTLWVRVPPRPSAATHQEHAKQEAGA